MVVWSTSLAEVVAGSMCNCASRSPLGSRSGSDSPYGLMMHHQLA